MSLTADDVNAGVKLARGELLLGHMAGKPQLAQALVATLQQQGQGLPVLPAQTLSALLRDAARTAAGTR